MSVMILILSCGTDLPGVLSILNIPLVQRPMLLMHFILLLRLIALLPIMPGWRMVMVILFLVSDGALVRGERLPHRVMTQTLYNSMRNQIVVHF